MAYIVEKASCKFKNAVRDLGGGKKVHISWKQRTVIIFNSRNTWKTPENPREYVSWHSKFLNYPH